MRFRSFVSLAFLAAGTFATLPASAQASREQNAEKLFNDAIGLVSAGKYAEACPKFEESQKLDPALGTQFDLADCYEHTGKKGSARKLFTEVADAAKAAGKSEREKSARERATALDAIAPRLTIAVGPWAADAHFEVTVDGVSLPAASWNHPQSLDAGKHAVAASAPGKKPFDAQVVLQDGNGSEVKIPELESKPAPLPVVIKPDEKPVDQGSGQRRTAVIAGGIGLVGVVVGASAGVLSLMKHGQAKGKCANFSACPDAQGRSDWNTATDAGTVSTIGFIAGGVGLAAGAVLYLTAPKNNSAASTSTGWWVMPSFGPGSAGIVAAGHL
ncbi:MAG: hypothetical protein ABIP39_13540 [Polyangiaceae bacterium]